MPEITGLGQQVRNILEAIEKDAALLEKHARVVEEMGYRIVEGGQTGPYDEDSGECDFQVADWRTSEVLVRGRGTYDDFERQYGDGSARDGRPWCDREAVHSVATDGKHDGFTPLSPVIVKGIPESLAAGPLIDWVESSATGEELAALTGLPAARIRKMLQSPEHDGRQ